MSDLPNMPLGWLAERAELAIAVAVGTIAGVSARVALMFSETEEVSVRRFLRLILPEVAMWMALYLVAFWLASFLKADGATGALIGVGIGQLGRRALEIVRTSIARLLDKSPGPSAGE